MAVAEAGIVERAVGGEGRFEGLVVEAELAAVIIEADRTWEGGEEWVGKDKFEEESGRKRERVRKGKTIKREIKWKKRDRQRGRSHTSMHKHAKANARLPLRVLCLSNVQLQAAELFPLHKHIRFHNLVGVFAEGRGGG